MTHHQLTGRVRAVLALVLGLCCASAWAQQPPPPPPPPVRAAPAKGEAMLPPSPPPLRPDRQVPQVAPPPAAQPSPSAPASQPAAPAPVEQTMQAPPVAPSAPPTTPKGAASQDFIKGELVHVGQRELLSRYNHFGIRLGPNILNSQAFVRVDPGFAWYFESGALALHVPLNLLAARLEGRTLSYGGMKVRREDWDERADFARLIRFATIGRKEDNLYLTLNTMRPATLGHGMLMRRYQPSIDVDRSLTGVMFEAYNDYAGFQFQANDITLQNKIFGGLVFLKPLSFFSDSMFAKNFSIGVEYLTDQQAPICIRRNNTLSDGSVDRSCVEATGHASDINPRTGLPRDNTFVHTDNDTGRYLVSEGVVHASGVSVEAKFVKTDAADIKVYGTLHKFLNEGGGSGTGLGVLGRFTTGSTWLNAFRLRAEYRNFGDGFLPQYFDTMYEINKYQFAHDRKTYQVTPTKYQAVFGDPQNGFERESFGRRQGYSVDASWGLFHKRRSNKQISLGIGASDSTGPYDSSAYAHIEFPAWQWLQLFGSYMRLNGESFDGLLSGNTFKDGNAVILAGVRVQLFLPILFINAHYSRSYQVVRGRGREYHLGNSNVVDASGNSNPWAADRLFESRDTLLVELELGYEFDTDD